MTITSELLQVERRMIVKGWKVEQESPGSMRSVRREFTSIHPRAHPSSVEFERKRIGEKGLPDWQPHITSVTVEERIVTPWSEVSE